MSRFVSATVSDYAQFADQIDELATDATRELKPGDEVFLHYGDGYPMPKGASLGENLD